MTVRYIGSGGIAGVPKYCRTGPPVLYCSSTIVVVVVVEVVGLGRGNENY